MRYTGHLDLQSAWERTFRRANLPLAYSQGFHPQARLNLACALPLGFTSQCELLDAWLETPQPVDQVLAALVKAAPPGIQITHLEEITDRQPALQTQVNAAEFTVTLLDSAPELETRMAEMLAVIAPEAYIARVSVHDVAHIRKTKKAIRRAFEVQIEGRGFGMVEVLAACPTNWRLDPLQAMQKIKSAMMAYYPLGEFSAPLRKETRP